MEDTRSPDNCGFDTTIPIPGLELTIDDLSLQVKIIAAELSRVGDSPAEAMAGTPPMASRRLEEALDKAIPALASISQHLENKLKSYNAETFQGSVHNSQQPSRPKNVNFAENFVSFARALDDAFVRILLLTNTLPKPKQRLEITNLVDGVRRAESEGKDTLTKIFEHSAVAERQSAEISEEAEKARQLSTVIENTHAEILDLKTQSEKAAQETTAAADATKKVIEHAEELKGSVEAYQPQFEKFQTALDGYQEDIRTGTAKQADLILELSRIRDAIEEKNDQACAMLSNATVAGLAASFGATRDKHDRELKEARRTFYCSIALLVILALPMVLYILPNIPWGGVAFERGGVGVGQLLGEIAARMTILLPGLLFVGFASRRHSSLFRLREQYEYKYNMAVSVEGFKQQAEDIADAIAGTTFYELLTRNPADAMDGGRMQKESNQPNPLVEAVRNHLRGKKNES